MLLVLGIDLWGRKVREPFKEHGRRASIFWRLTPAIHYKCPHLPIKTQHADFVLEILQARSSALTNHAAYNYVIDVRERRAAGEDLTMD